MASEYQKCKREIKQIWNKRVYRYIILVFFWIFFVPRLMGNILSYSNSGVSIIRKVILIFVVVFVLEDEFGRAKRLEKYWKSDNYRYGIRFLIAIIIPSLLGSYLGLSGEQSGGIGSLLIFLLLIDIFRKAVDDRSKQKQSKEKKDSF